jgi:predicted dehydrogenase
VLVLGAGQIAAGYDTPEAKSCLTHAHAIKEHSGFELLGFNDIDTTKAYEAAKKWNIQAYNIPEYADIIVICTPDEVHLESVKQAIALSPKLIILEKPIARTLTDVRKIARIAQNVPVQVNFSRRFVPEYQALAEDIPEYGAFLTGSGLYGKGLIHNGLHAVDLLRFLVGDISSVETTDELFDYYEDDSTKSVLLTFKHGGKFHLLGLDCRSYTLFELDLCFEKARIRISDSGSLIQVYKPTHSLEYAGYMYLSLQYELRPDLGCALPNLYQNVYEYLTQGKKLISPLEGAITEEVYMA